MSGAVFFSGGTALRETASEAARRSLDSTHIITTFDSGGSSRELRLAFNMPAVGDLRNRLIALASPGRFNAASLLNQRLPKGDASPQMASALLLAAQLPKDQLEPIKEDIDAFLIAVPPDFDARGASIGNLAITGAYLRLGRDLAEAAARYAEILQIRGVVRPVTEASLQLGAILANGETVIGQHKFKNLPAPVEKLFLCDDNGCPREALLQKSILQAINSAALICLPMGSFYSSILATLLPAGVGRAILASPAKKIFIPNTGHDPELFNLDLPGQAALLETYVKADGCGQGGKRVLDYMLVDPVNGAYARQYGADVRNALQNMDIRVLEAHIVRKGNGHDPGAVLDALQKLL